MLQFKPRQHTSSLHFPGGDENRRGIPYSLKAQAQHLKHLPDLLPSFSAFTNNNSPAPLSSVVHLPAAWLLVKKQQVFDIKIPLPDTSETI